MLEFGVGQHMLCRFRKLISMQHVTIVTFNMKKIVSIMFMPNNLKYICWRWWTTRRCFMPNRPHCIAHTCTCTLIVINRCRGGSPVCMCVGAQLEIPVYPKR